MEKGIKVRITETLLTRIADEINKKLPIGHHATLASEQNPDIETDHIEIRRDGTGKLLKRIVIDLETKTTKIMDVSSEQN